MVDLPESVKGASGFVKRNKDLPFSSLDAMLI
jgi:hypothetical protein